MTTHLILDGNDPTVTKGNEFVGGDPLHIRPRVERRTVIEGFGLPESDVELVCSRLERLGLCDVGRFVFPTRLGSSSTGPRRYDSIQLRPLGVVGPEIQCCTLFRVVAVSVVDGRLDAAIQLLDGPAHNGHSMAAAAPAVENFGDIVETGPGRRI